MSQRNNPVAAVMLPLTVIGLILGGSFLVASATEPVGNDFASLQSQFDALRSAHADEIVVIEAGKLLELLGELQGISKALYATQGRTGPDQKKLAAKLSDILSRYEDGIRYEVPDKKDPLFRRVRTLIDRAADLVFDCVGAQGRVVALADKSGNLAAELAILTLLVRHSDEQWDWSLAKSLPDWMKSSANLKVMEAACLTAHRPVVAYHLWAQRAPGRRPAETRIDEYVEHLYRCADLQFAAKEYPKGLGFLAEGICLADRFDLPGSGDRLRFRLAEAYAVYGHPDLAADQMTDLMRTNPQSEQLGRAAVLRLKYRYAHGQYARVRNEGRRIKDDPRLAGVRPQILYILWVTCRRQNDSAAARSIRDDFVQRYPENQLSADMHFARAMELLATGDYSKAGELLDRIVARYPRAGVARKAKAIRAKLNVTTKPVASKPPSE